MFTNSPLADRIRFLRGDEEREDLSSLEVSDVNTNRTGHCVMLQNSTRQTVSNGLEIRMANMKVKEEL